MDAGYFDEAQAWRDWLLRAVAGSPDKLQIMYGLDGARRLPEQELDWLPGYEGSKPVRVGNAAASQLQLDVYGELMDALYQARKGGLVESTAGWHYRLRSSNIWRPSGNSQTKVFGRCAVRVGTSPIPR